MALDDLPESVRENYECHEWKHATTILKNDFPKEWEDILSLLVSFRLQEKWITTGGKNKSDVAKYIDRFLEDRGWSETGFKTKIAVDDHLRETPTHKVDCFKNRIALETEWNNKDPFFDRDLNNFRLLFDLQVISVGIIITRSTELRDVFKSIGCQKSYGNSTTHISKLIPRVEGGGAGGCPVLALGIKKSLYVPDSGT